MSSELHIGDSVNLLFGYRPWDHTDPVGHPFFSPEKAATVAVDPNPVVGDNKWHGMYVTVHPDAASLVSTLYGCDVVLGMDGRGKVPAGPLVLGDADAKSAAETLGRRLGVSLDEQHGYLLARIVRETSTAEHPLVTQGGDPAHYLTEEGRKEIAALPVAGTRSSVENARAYLDFSYRFGTHFVSRITRGDVIYQVFAYSRTTFQEKVAKGFAALADGAEEISGQDAWQMREYTLPHTGGPNGPVMVERYGAISAVSRDPELTRSVERGEWIDDEYAQANQSIFAAYLSGGPKASGLRKVVPIGVTLTGIDTLCRDPRVAASVNRMTRGGLLQKYSPGVRLALAGPEPDWKDVYPAPGGALLSTLGTPTVDVYQERLNLSRIRVGQPKGVKSLTAMAHVMEASGTVELPGTEKVRLVSHIIDTGSETTLPVVRVPASAAVEIHAGRMSGGLGIESGPAAPQRQVLVDGLRLSTPGEPDPTTGRYLVNVETAVLTRPSAQLVDSLANSTQCALVAAESLLQSRGEHASTSHPLGRAFLEWLAGIIPADTESRELLAVRSRALYLARAASEFLTPAVEVSYFKYDSYRDLVAGLLNSAEHLKGEVRNLENKLAARRAEELAAKNQETINKNIKATGTLLRDYIGALKEHEEDLSQQHRRIIEQKQNDYKATGVDVLNLQASVEQQVAEVGTQVNALHAKIKAMEEMKWVTFSIEIAKIVFSAVGDIRSAGAGASDAANKLSTMAKNLKRLQAVLKALGEISGKLYGQLSDIKDVHERMKGLSGDLRMPTSAEWEEFKTTFSNALEPLNNLEELRQHGADLTAAFAILTLRGKAWIEAQAHLSQLQMEIDAALLKKDLGDRQHKRLDDLFGKLHLDDTEAPELDGVDLIGLTGEAELRVKHALTALGQTLQTQDAAIQYEYLGEPQPIRNFTLNALLDTMVEQQRSILKGIQNLQPLPQKVREPITFAVREVPHAALYKKEWEFEIPLDDYRFGEYTVVRVDKVVARIKGIKKGEGSHIIALTYQGNPFRDRDKKGTSFAFSTVPRILGPFRYDRGTNKLTFGDQPGPLVDKITRVTPFSTWKISLPDDPANKNLEFDQSTVDIELDFWIEAQRPTPTVADTDLLELADQQVARVAGMAPGMSENGLVQDIYRVQSALNGWDAVLCMDRVQVNKILEKLYATDHPGGEMDFEFAGWSGYMHEHDDELYGEAIKVVMKLEKPEVTFDNGQKASAIFTQNVRSGSVTTGSKKVSEEWDWKQDPFNENDVTWSKKPKPIDPLKKPRIKGTVPFEVLTGKVNTQGGTKAVALVVKKGEFRAENLELDNLEGANLAIKNAYYQNDVEYHINTIDLTKISTYDSLKPTAFKVTAKETSEKKDVLFVFIATEGRADLDPTLAITEPLPEGSDAALLINSEILFRDIVGKGFNSPNLWTEPMAPTEGNKAWRTRIRGTLSGDIEWPRRWMNFNGEVTFHFLFSKENRNAANITLSDFHFQRQEQGNLVARLEMEEYPIEFMYYGCHYEHGCDPERLWTKATVKATLTATAVYSITVTDPPDQGIKIGNATVTPSIQIHNLQSENSCSAGEADVKNHLAGQLRTLLPNKVKDAVENISFNEASVFALQNLLFPAGKNLVLKTAYAPGDLLILGNLDSRA
ncbi:hypothetical protein [Streptomyces profundus]|uniref:hypothetical protein n=1 Tax=Streptomyces profundus TaxID=2867410 RepID=UPI001D167332|nr:hypothetical protein [Streptomyces sp. MA3_2.13]UED87051.1 hypothetical protein K4G22_24960 [Streptomyces sp. MA3_2.13]